MKVSSRPSPSIAAVPPPHSTSHPHRLVPLRVGCSHRRRRPIPCPFFRSVPCLTGPAHHVGCHSRGGPHCCRGPYCRRAEHDRRHDLLNHEARRYRRVKLMRLICSTSSTRYVETKHTHKLQLGTHCFLGRIGHLGFAPDQGLPALQSWGGMQHPLHGHL